MINIYDIHSWPSWSKIILFTNYISQEWGVRDTPHPPNPTKLLKKPTMGHRTDVDIFSCVVFSSQVVGNMEIA